MANNNQPASKPQVKGNKKQMDKNVLMFLILMGSLFLMALIILVVTGSIGIAKS